MLSKLRKSISEALAALVSALKPRRPAHESFLPAGFAPDGETSDKPLIFIRARCPVLSRAISQVRAQDAACTSPPCPTSPLPLLLPTPGRVKTEAVCK